MWVWITKWENSICCDLNEICVRNSLLFNIRGNRILHISSCYSGLFSLHPVTKRDVKYCYFFKTSNTLQVWFCAILIIIPGERLFLSLLFKTRASFKRNIHYKIEKLLFLSYDLYESMGTMGWYEDESFKLGK